VQKTWYFGSRSRSHSKIKCLGLRLVSAPYLLHSLKNFNETQFKCAIHWDDIHKAQVSHFGTRIKVTHGTQMFEPAFLVHFLSPTFFYETWLICAVHSDDVQKEWVSHFKIKVKVTLEGKIFWACVSCQFHIYIPHSFKDFHETTNDLLTETLCKRNKLAILAQGQDHTIQTFVGYFVIFVDFILSFWQCEKLQQ